jgi:hypothetical protein
MFRRLTASVLSFLLLCAAVISLTEELAAADLFSRAAPQEVELFGGTATTPLPDYPEGIAQRLLRKRLAPRAMLGARPANPVALGFPSRSVNLYTLYRSSPQDLYQHQTSLRI